MCRASRRYWPANRARAAVLSSLVYWGRPRSAQIAGIDRGCRVFSSQVPIQMRRRLRSPRGAAAADAFAESVLAHLPSLFALALRLTRSRADAEDLVQDTVVKALRFSARFEPGTNLKAWLFTILHNTWKNGRRAASRDGVHVSSDRIDEEAPSADGPIPPDTPEQLLLRSTLDADLQVALDELPDAFREAVLLRDVEELSYAEIAAMLGIPVGTVMSRISRGRRQLFERLIAREPGSAIQATEAVRGAPRAVAGAGEASVGNDGVVGAGFSRPGNAWSRSDG